MPVHSMASSQRNSDDSTSLPEAETFIAMDNPLAQTDSLSSLPQSCSAASSRSGFTARGLLVGLLIGVLICFCNTYFGLQTGWGSGMSMPSSLIGFAAFRSISPYLKLPFGPVENVLVQTVAGAVGTMSLGCGFVGIIPAMEFLLKKAEGAPISLGIGRLTIWSLGVCLFGSVFALALRKQIILREKLRFPSGTATALLIGVLHGKVSHKSECNPGGTFLDEDEMNGLLNGSELDRLDPGALESSIVEDDTDHFPTRKPPRPQDDLRSDVRDKYIQLLLQAFSVSAVYTITSYFIPQVRDLPIFGQSMATNWLWTLNASPAYIGQGAIMGPTTTFHMLLGAIVGWGVLSPLAKRKGWAPGSIDDWEEGSRGWIMWISLAIMLADSMINLGWLILRPLKKLTHEWAQLFKVHTQHGGTWHNFFPSQKTYRRYMTEMRLVSTPPKAVAPALLDESFGDAPPDQRVSNTFISILLPLALAFCVLCVQFSFGSYIAPALSTLATLLAVIASVMGVRALGETDLNPTSGISKLVQLVIAVVTPENDSNAIVINLIAGSIADSGAGQAGDLMQYLKTGQLLNASPKSLFYGHIIGSVFGVVVSPVVYKLYVSVYKLPSKLFQMPSAYLWIFTARLVTGKGLPRMAWQFGVCAGIIFISTTVVRIYLGSQSSAKIRNLQRYVPGGIPVAVGMYTTPSFSIPQAVGGLLSWWYMRYNPQGETTVIVIASGLILGEGIVSMVNVGLASLNVPHL